MRARRPARDLYLNRRRPSRAAGSFYGRKAVTGPFHTLGFWNFCFAPPVEFWGFESVDRYVARPTIEEALF